MVMMIRDRRACGLVCDGAGESVLSDSDKPILTHTGKSIRPLTLAACDVCLEDVAHGVAYASQFNTGRSRFFSLAEHCLNVMSAAANLALHLMDGQGQSLDAKLTLVRQVALLHESASAYLVGDFERLRRPLVVDRLRIEPVEWEKLNGIESRIVGQVMSALGVELGSEAEAIWSVVDLADQVCFATELRDMVGLQLRTPSSACMAMPNIIEPRFTAIEAKMQFLSACEMLGVGM